MFFLLLNLGILIFVLSCLRIFRNVNDNIDLQNALMNEVLIASICGISDKLICDYIRALRKHGIESRQASVIKNDNLDSEDFIRFADNVKEIGKKLW